MHQDTHAEIDSHVSSVYQDTPITTARRINHITANAFALSIGLHLTLITVLAQIPPHPLQNIKPSLPITVVLVKSAPKKSAPTPVSITKEIPKLPPPLPLKPPQPIAIIAPKQASDEKPPVQTALGHKPKPKKPGYKPKKIEPRREHESRPILVHKSVTKPLHKFMHKLTTNSVPKFTTKNIKKSVLQHPKPKLASLPSRHKIETPAAVLTKPIKETRSTSLREPTRLNHTVRHQNTNTRLALRKREIAASLAKNSGSIPTQPGPKPQTDTKRAININGSAKSTLTSRPTPVSTAYSPPTAAPAYLHNPPPIYPRLAQRAHMEGHCLLEVVVTANGTPHSVRIIQGSGYSVLDQSAVSAVSQWRFVPAHRGGNAVTAPVEVPVRFRLAN